MKDRHAVIFDFDGVIVDSESAEYESHRAIFEACGVELTLDEWCRGIGTIAPPDYWFDRLVERAGRAPTHDEFRRATSRRFRELVRMEPMPGVLALLEELTRARIPLAIASTASARWVCHAAGEIGVSRFFSVIITADDVALKKPAPDVYLEAARRLAVQPACCVAIEDSAHGLRAAKAAGMRAIVVPHRLTEGHDLAAADLRVASATDLTPAAILNLCGIQTRAGSTSRSS